MKIRKFNTEGHAAWKSFYNEVFLEIKKEAKGSKITTEDIKNGYNNNLKNTTVKNAVRISNTTYLRNKATMARDKRVKK